MLAYANVTFFFVSASFQILICHHQSNVAAVPLCESLLSDICLSMTSASSRLVSVCQLAWKLALALSLAAAYLLCRAGCWGRRPAAGRWASPFLLPSPRLLPHSRRARCPWCSANQSSPGLRICRGHTDAQPSQKNLFSRKNHLQMLQGILLMCVCECFIPV